MYFWYCKNNIVFAWSKDTLLVYISTLLDFISALFFLIIIIDKMMKAIWETSIATSVSRIGYPLPGIAIIHIIIKAIVPPIPI